LDETELILFLVPISFVLSNTDFPLKTVEGSRSECALGVKGQIATVEERLAVKKVGVLSAMDREILDSRLRVWLQI